MARPYNARSQKIYTGVEGAEEIEKLLQEMGLAANEILDEAALAGATIAFEDAKRRAPVKTGNLKASLKLNKPRANKDRQKKRSSASVGFNYKKAYYLPFVELGHKTKSGEHVPAKPFLRPAIDKNKKTIAEAVNKAISDALGRVMR